MLTVPDSVPWPVTLMPRHGSGPKKLVGWSVKVSSMLTAPAAANAGSAAAANAHATMRMSFRI